MSYVERKIVEGEAKARSEAQDAMRGYVIDRKRVVMAYAAEAVIIVTSLIGAALFAKIYGHSDPATMTMMMLAPLSYAVVEFCRVPLALSIRTQRSRLFSVVAVIGVVCAAGVTVKSLSQLGEIMFRPRLIDVVHARERLTDAQNLASTLALRIKDADEVVDQRKEELRAAEKQLAITTQRLGDLPAQKCLPISGVTKDGRPYKTMRCVADPRTSEMTHALQTASADRDATSRKLDGARTERNQLERVETDKALSDRQIEYREAVLNSQLHSFTAMVYGKEPTEVSDAEIHCFLRFFVFLPAICAALASTLIALTAVHRLEVEEPVTVDNAAAGYLLGPFAHEVVQAATEAAQATARATLAKARASCVPA